MASCVAIIVPLGTIKPRSGVTKCLAQGKEPVGLKTLGFEKRKWKLHPGMGAPTHAQGHHYVVLYRKMCEFPWRRELRPLAMG